jgi:L-lysine exporter family protein LysE/ArgO
LDYGLLQLGIVLGLGAAAPIGPVNVEIARRTLRGGFRPGFALGCGAVSVDVLYAVLSSLGLQRALDRPAVFYGLAGGGVVVLLYLSALCFRAGVRAMRADPIDAANADGGIASDGASAPPPSGSTGGSARGAYAAGVLMTLLNPLTLAFWFVAVPGTLGPITRDAGGQLPVICAGVFAGTFGWVVSFAGILALAGRYRKRWWLAAADLAGGATLLAFAGVALWRLARPFI